MLVSMLAGRSGMAQFSHPEFGGSGQWMAGGAIMISDGIVTLPRDERERIIRGTDFHAAATTSRHVLIAAARSTRCD
jgi:hypothetical protein